MTHRFADEAIREIIWKQIEEDEKPGEHVGGSGHLGQVDCRVDWIDEPSKMEEGWTIIYRYTVSITTEFTVYPDNPPHESMYEKTILIDDTGEILRKLESKLISSNIEFRHPLDDVIPIDDTEGVPEDLLQRVIDLKTGRDITGEYISMKLRELETLADGIIQHAMKEVDTYQENKREIYETAYWKIHEQLGVGSIGPATAAVSPLMAEKKRELADVLGIIEEERIF